MLKLWIHFPPWDCLQHDKQLSVNHRLKKGNWGGDRGPMCMCFASKLRLRQRGGRSRVKGHDSGSRRGRTGRMRFPNEESWVMKKPDECACACCRAAFCWAAMCCCSALSLNSLRLGLDSEMLAPGVFMDEFCISRFLSFSSSARIATRVLFGKACPGGLAAIACANRKTLLKITNYRSVSIGGLAMFYQCVSSARRLMLRWWTWTGNDKRAPGWWMSMKADLDAWYSSCCCTPMLQQLKV